jgi:hypothetical protein
LGSLYFPLALILVGLWLILRNFERIPTPSPRASGRIGTFLSKLTGNLSFFTFSTSREASFAQAAASRGGGYLGAALYELSRSNLGVGGAAIALLAWLIIALSLTLDVTPADLFRWLPPLVLRLQDWWEDVLSRRKLASSPAVLAPDYRQIWRVPFRRRQPCLHLLEWQSPSPDPAVG